MAKTKPVTKRPTTKTATDDPLSIPGTTQAGNGPSHEQVARRAHQIWLEGGCQANCEHANWLEAEKELRAKRL